MAVPVRLPEKVVSDAERFANLSYRTIPKQIEYWFYMGKLADENPDLPASFIKGALEGKQEIENGEVSPFRFRRK
jgi:hypothetical protein